MRVHQRLRRRTPQGNGLVLRLRSPLDRPQRHQHRRFLSVFPLVHPQKIYHLQNQSHQPSVRAPQVPKSCAQLSPVILFIIFSNQLRINVGDVRREDNQVRIPSPGWYDSWDLDQDRKRTDILCTIIGALFALTMFILAFALMDTGTTRPTQITTNKATSPLTPTGFPATTDPTPTTPSSTSQTSSISMQYPFLYLESLREQVSQRRRY